jgi:hypothetical protein
VYQKLQILLAVAVVTVQHTPGSKIYKLLGGFFRVQRSIYEDKVPERKDPEKQIPLTQKSLLFL